MVKGISRQVIVVDSPEPKLFEQAIFILKDEVVMGEGVSNEALLKEAKQLLYSNRREKRIPLYQYGPVWACGGALVTGFAWLLSTFL